MSRYEIWTRTIRTTALAFAAVLSASWLATAQELRPTTSEFTGTLVGEVSVSELAPSEANRQAWEEQPYGAVKLVDVPAGASPASGDCPVGAVVISGDGAGDQTVGSPEVNALSMAGCESGL